jgi:hypothetical protein
MKSTKKSAILQVMSAKLEAYFQNDAIETIAKQVKFVQRKSPLSGLRFVQALVIGLLEKPTASLNHLAQVCGDLDVPISAQGVDARINQRSVEFLQEVLRLAMSHFQQQYALALPLLQTFRAIYLLDSTFLQLPEAMQAEFPGAGGGGSRASLKIQLVFEFLHGRFAQIDLQPGRSADQAYRDYLALMQAGSLILFDLGYFCLDALTAIAKAQAFFLARYHYPTALFTPAREPIDLLPWLRKLSAERVEIPILLGSRARHRLPCRLIVERIPEDIAAERRRKAKCQARKHHKNLTQAYLELLGWTLMVTNVPAAQLPTAQVILLYRIRWQVELLFKLWKSYAGMKHIGPWRRERILTEIYARLIGCVLFQFVTAPLRIPDDTWSGRELSLFQAHNILGRFAQRLLDALAHAADLTSLLARLIEDLLRFGMKQRRQKRPNALQLIAAPLA